MMIANENEMAIPGRLELPTYGLGNRRSIRLSYGTGLFSCRRRRDKND